MEIEFLNCNQDSRLDPEIKAVALSRDAKNRPPAFCLPWVEAARYSIQLKANHEYWIRKRPRRIEACAVVKGKPIPVQELFGEVPEGASYFAEGEVEKKQRKVSLGQSPGFSSPWQSRHAHSVTLKLGISWWTPPGWGLFFTSAVHRNEEFRVVEGFVRSDLWHRDVPIVIQPLAGEVRIPKYSVVASAFLLSAEAPSVRASANPGERMKEIAVQTSYKRMSQHYYKALVLGGKKQRARD